MRKTLIEKFSIVFVPLLLLGAGCTIPQPQSTNIEDTLKQTTDLTKQQLNLLGDTFEAKTKQAAEEVKKKVEAEVGPAAKEVKEKAKAALKAKLKAEAEKRIDDAVDKVFGN